MAQSSAFARWLRTTLALLLLMGAAAVALFVTHRRSADVTALFHAMPADTGSAVAVQDLDKLLRALDQIAAQPGAPPELVKQLADLKQQSQAQLGFDATDPAAWDKAGLELGGAWGLASSGQPGDPLGFVYLPTTDADGAQAVLSRSLTGQGATLELHDANGLKVTAVSWPPTAVPEAFAPRAFAMKGSFLVVAGSKEPLDAESALRKQLQGSGLDASPELQRVRTSVGEPWTAFAYTAPAAIRGQMTSPDVKPAEPFAQDGFGGALSIQDDRISLRARALGDPQHTPSIFAQPNPPEDHVPGATFGAARASLDLHALATALQQTPDGQKTLARLQQLVAPLDLQKDLVDGLDGQMTFGVLLPKPGALSPADAVVAFGAHDPKRLVDALAQPLARLGFSPAGPGWLTAHGMRIGAAEKAVVVVAAGTERLDEAQKTIPTAGASFAATLPDAARQGFAHGPSLWVYLDLEQTAEILGRTHLVQARNARLLRSLQAASAGLDVRDGVTRFDLDLYPPPGGFAQAMLGGKDAGP